MAKVIGIKSRNEIMELPFSADDGVKAIEAMITSGITNPRALAQIMKYISNNSGIDAFAVSQQLIAKNLKKAGQ